MTSSKSFVILNPFFSGLESNSADDLDLIDQMANMSIARLDGDKKENIDPEEEMAAKVLDPSNPVFKERKASSKIETVLEKLSELKEKHDETGVMEKAVIVSQWTSMLNIIKSHVQQLGFKVCEINGQIPV